MTADEINDAYRQHQATMMTAQEEGRRKLAVFDELLAACRTCDEAIAELIDCARPISIDGSLDAELPAKWDRLRAARHLAKRAVENGDKVKGGG